MKYGFVALCALLATQGLAAGTAAAAPILHTPNLACSTLGFSGASPLSRAPGTPLKCWSTQVTCPPGTELLQNGIDLGGHPVTWIGYDASQRSFFYTCAPVVKQPPAK